MSGIGATEPDAVVVIDTSALTRPRVGAAGRTAVILKQSGLAMAGLLGSIVWFFAVLWVAASLSQNMRGAGEAVVVIIGLVIGAVPIIAFGLYFVRFRNRHFSGVGAMIATADFGEEELRREVPHLGVPLRTVIDGVGGFARGLGSPPPPFRETDPAKIRRARNIKLGLVAAVVGAVILYAATQSMVAALPLLVAFAGYPLTLMRARQAVQPSLAEVRARDPRKPVLLLRSFQDDTIQMIHRFRTRIGDVEQTRRFEQQVAGMLEAFGPLIAVGKPGEELPQIGAARAYLSEAEWQPAVIRWIDEAVFIAMIAGATEWIRWELGRILEMGRVQHLLILVPPTPGKLNWEMGNGVPVAERWKNVLAALATTRWSPALQSLDTAGLLLVLLRPDGTVIAIRRDGKAAPYADDYQVAIAIALYDVFCRRADRRA